MKIVVTLLVALSAMLGTTISDDFETGDLNLLNWESYGDSDWVIDSNSNQGDYSVKSGEIYDSQHSDLTIELNFNEDGEVSFYRKVSCEPPGSSVYDGLFFYIDDVEMGVWAGEVDWEQVSFNVESGLHTLKWSYIKDYTTANGDDCAWIDDVVFTNATIPEDTEAPELISLAGNEVTIDENMLVTLVIREATGLDIVEADVEINGNLETISFSEVSKDRRFYTYQADLGVYTTPTLGMMSIKLEDTLGHSMTSEPYVIGWYPEPVIYLSESFEGGEIPENWDVVQVAGELGDWTVESEALSPSGTLPQDGEKLIRYSSGFTASGNNKRLELPPVEISKDGSILIFGFHLFHSLGNTWANDSLIVEIKDGDDWVEVDKFYRYTGDPNQWKYYEIELDQYTTGSTIQLGLLGCSANGRDLNLDNMKLFREFDVVDLEETLLANTHSIVTNYPNPFNPTTTISFDMVNSGLAKVSIFNSKGEFVTDLIDKKVGIGTHNIHFDGKALNSGIYFANLSIDGKFQTSRKLVLIK